MSLPINIEEGGKPVDRMETGPLQFVGDWPGIFIRGDQAAHFAFTLRRFIGSEPTVLDDDYINWQVLDGLVNTLESCIIQPPGDNENATSSR